MFATVDFQQFPLPRVDTAGQMMFVWRSRGRYRSVQLRPKRANRRCLSVNFIAKGASDIANNRYRVTVFRIRDCHSYRNE